MATQSLVEQTVLFISPNGEFDETGIFANSIIQSLAQNSAGNALITAYQQYRSWNGSAWTQNIYFEIKCFVASTFQTTIQNNVAALQSAFPQYTITTYGQPTTFGH